MNRQLFQFEPLTKTLTTILESSDDLASAAPALLEAVAKGFDAEWAAYWRVNEQVLRVIATWSQNPFLLQPLIRESESRALTLHEGAAGRVWSSGQPFCTTDLIQDMRLPRSLHANTAGFSSGLWFPIQANQSTSGIIEVLTSHSWSLDQEALSQLISLGETMGELSPERDGP